jgi:porin
MSARFSPSLTEVEILNMKAGSQIFSAIVPATLLCALSSFIGGQARAQNPSDGVGKAGTPEPSQGLLPISDYTGDFWKRATLSGDWGGARTDLANKGVQIGVEWNQYVQGIIDGGRDRTTQYGGTLDYTANLDLMRMGVLPGALVKFRAESRYGRSVNGQAGPLLPVNSDASFPLTSQLDEDIPITITDLNYTQFLSKHLGVTLGKMNTLDADPNEFASGRGTSQFLNANFIFNPTLALRLPYSTLAAGIVWMPIPVGADGGITISSSVLNTADSSTTSGFSDFDKGTTWTTEADFQYRLGGLPGGVNFGGLYSFNQDFAELHTRAIVTPGRGLTIPNKESTWALYGSAWQYVFTPETEKHAIDLRNGEPDLKGIGFFTRIGFADKETNPVEWAISGGLGGRGIIPTRNNDTLGIGYYFDRLQASRFSNRIGLEDSAQGFEAFYNIAITPACRVTFDMQVVEPIKSGISTATILGMRVALNF